MNDVNPTVDNDSIIFENTENSAKPSVFQNILLCIYRYLYFFSLISFRYLKKSFKKFNSVFAKADSYLKQYKRIAVGRRKMRLVNLYNAFILPFVGVKNDVNLLIKKIKDLPLNRSLNIIPAVFQLIFYLLRPVFKFIFALACYAAPVLAAIALTLTVRYFNNLTFALSVEYDGKIIGYIENESTFDLAREDAIKRTLNDANLEPIDAIPKFTLCVINSNDFSSKDELVDNMIVQSGNNIVSASGFYVDDKFIGATTSPNELLIMLDELLDKYRTGDKNESVSFIRKIKLTQGWYPSSSIFSDEYFQQLIYGDTEGAQYYTVTYGDSPYRVAKINGLTLNELKAMNPGIEDGVFVGQKVLVSRSEPFMKIKVTRRETYTESTDYGVTKVKDSTLYYGFTKIKSEGKKGTDQIVADVVYIDGVEVSRTIISRTTIKKPVNQVLSVGTAAKYQSGSSINSFGLIWPANSHVVNCHFGGYSGHTGIDISAGGIYGAPIYAAQSGQVIKVQKQSYGYGYHLVIDHGGGLTTLYAHCSKIYVKVGDIVKQGETIAAIGMTGNTTGLHLHFELRVNGKPINPYSYIKGNYLK